MAIVPDKITVTYEDYVAMPDDGNRYEVLGGGELFVSPSPSRRHQSAAGVLFTELLGFVDEHRLGVVLIAPFDVRLDETNVVQPDILFVSRARRDIVQDNRIDGAPDLVVEVLSPSNAFHDLVRKREACARHGVPYLSFVDPSTRSVAAYGLRDGEYTLLKHAIGTALFSAEPFPDLTIHLGELWRDPLRD
ncbi:MAG: Uma2 family endonuclease [Chloroflexota bacterium]